MVSAELMFLNCGVGEDSWESLGLCGDPSHPPSSPSPPAFNLPIIRVFFKESVLHIRWPKYWDFSFSISPSNEYSGLISFRTHWIDLEIQGMKSKGLS